MTNDTLSHRAITLDGETYVKLADAVAYTYALREWRSAIYEALINWNDAPLDGEAPRDALRRLIRLEVQAALDPAVSKNAETLVAQGRRAGVKEALQHARGYEAIAYQHGNLPALDPHECAAQAAREIAAGIEALMEKKDE
jgi:hypothetical protein